MSDGSLATTVGVGQSASSTRYHYLTDSHSRSLCGGLDSSGNRKKEVTLTLSEEDAIRHGLHLCPRCADSENRNPSTEDTKRASQ